MIIWLIGLSGAGKTTIGRELVDRLNMSGNKYIFLNGDILRDVWGDSLGHTIEGRRKNAHRISHLCRMLDHQQVNVVACVLSIFPEWQQWNRENFSSYFEIFVDAPMEQLIERDSKGLYKKALAGEVTNVVGVDIPFPKPPASNLVLQNDATTKTPGILADEILAAMGSF